MSLHIEVLINERRIGGLTITREHGDGIDRDSVNEYSWRYVSHGKKLASGAVNHRYGDGALALARTVLGQCEHITAAKGGVA